MTSPQVVVIEQQLLLGDSDLVACAQSLGGLRWDRRPWRGETVSSLDGIEPDLVLMEAGATSGHVASLVQWLRRAAPTTPAVAILPASIEEGALEAVARAVDDFVLWPAPISELRERLARLLGRRRDLAAMRGRLTAEVGLRNLVGRDPAFVEMTVRLQRLARTDANVLITGETGTGKELCARAIHYLSSRANRPFLPINCGAIPVDLFESEVFGHEKGAFTGASLARPGLVAEAQSGTLFLDEIETLTLAAQVKLLRFMEDRTYHALGSARPRASDVRIVAATNASLEDRVRAGTFRDDLFYRLGVLTLVSPALRERRGDVTLLAAHFLAKFADAPGTLPKQLSAGALETLERYGWPGNVRELQNVIHQAVVLVEGPVIDVEDLAIPRSSPSPRRAGSMRQAKARVLEEFEKAYVGELLRTHQGNVTRAARQAQKDRRAFGRLIKKYYPPTT